MMTLPIMTMKQWIQPLIITPSLIAAKIVLTRNANISFSRLCFHSFDDFRIKTFRNFIQFFWKILSDNNNSRTKSRGVGASPSEKVTEQRWELGILKIFDNQWTGWSGRDDCGYPEWCSSKLLSHTDGLVGASHWIFLINKSRPQVLLTIGVEGEGGVGELLEREGGGGVDTNTRVVGGEILAPTASQENDQRQGDTGDNLNIN